MLDFRAHLGHLAYMAIHKIAVYRYGRSLGLRRGQLLVHDLSKFTRGEWPAYTRWFSGPRVKGSLDHLAFQFAWAQHWQRNPHHPEHWANRWTLWTVTPIEPRAMPDVFLREMIADWHAAALAKRWCYLMGLMNVQHPGLTSRVFYERYGATMRLHPATRAEVERLLGVE